MARAIAEKKKQKSYDVEHLHKRLSAVENEINNIMKAIKAGIITPTTKIELKKAEGQKAEIRRQLEANGDKTDNITTLLPRAVDRFQKMVNDLENVSQMEVNQIRNKISALIGGKITLKPDDTGHLAADVQGDYLGLMQAIDVKGQNLLVAGAGFEPAAFRL